MKAIPKADNENPSFYRASTLGPILLLSGIFFLTFIARVAFGPLMPRIEKQMDIDHAQAGYIFLCLSAGYFTSLLCSGFVSLRICHRKTIAVSVSGAGIALFCVSASNSLPVLAASVFLLGLFTGLYLPSGISTLTSMVDPGNWGKALSIHELAPNLGFVAAPVLVEVGLAFFSWRAIPATIGILSICAGIAVFFTPTASDCPGSPPDFTAIRKFISNTHHLKMIVLFGLGIGSTVGIYSMLPLYLTTGMGISREAANYWIAAARGAGLISALASGWAADRFGPGLTMSILLGLTGLATIGLGVASSPFTAISLVFAQAFLSTGFFPPAFAVLSATVSPEYRNLAVSFTIPFAFIFGSGIVPAAIGVCGKSGSFGAGISMVGAIIALGGFASLLHERKKHE
ncbi:MAG: MFS transporter [Deltaproteobacteria bacterium]|nr:MFS transporter [Deltaproteobacteria bacterium]